MTSVTLIELPRRRRSLQPSSRKRHHQREVDHLAALLAIDVTDSHALRTYRATTATSLSAIDLQRVQRVLRWLAEPTIASSPISRMLADLEGVVAPKEFRYAEVVDLVISGAVTYTEVFAHEAAPILRDQLALVDVRFLNLKPEVIDKQLASMTIGARGRSAKSPMRVAAELTHAVGALDLRGQTIAKITRRFQMAWLRVSRARGEKKLVETHAQSLVDRLNDSPFTVFPVRKSFPTAKRSRR